MAKLWKVESLQSFLASGKSFWNLIQNALQTDSDKSKGYIKEATYGLVYGMSKKNLVARLNEQLGSGMGEKFLEINLIKDILEARTHAMSYYMATGSITDAYGKSFKVRVYFLFSHHEQVSHNQIPKQPSDSISTYVRV